MAKMAWHLAGVWEAVAEATPDALAVVNAGVGRTWRDYEQRAARFAQVLLDAGHGVGSKVGVYAYNSNAYLEAYFGAFKARTTPFNVNYRYTEGELLYLLDNADAEAIVFDAQFGVRIDALRGRLPKLRTLIELDDGSGAHLEGALRFDGLVDAGPTLAPQAYGEDDIFIVYTGGTTGMPKGVMSRQADRALAGVQQAFAMAGMTCPMTREDLVGGFRRLRDAGATRVSLAASPLMHGTGLTIGAHNPQLGGGCAVTMRNEHFDAAQLWRTVERERVTHLTIVGDAFARPMLAALEVAQAAGAPFDLSSLRGVSSAGVMFSQEVKQGLLRHADITIHDVMAATEGGMGVSIVSRQSPPGPTAVFSRNPNTKVFDEDDEEVGPGSDKIGLIANGGFTPIGYYKDPDKSARTFRVIKGQRYSFPGDYAKVAADGSLILLGRGSNCINTGGEKVFPEEVEEALKAHPDVEDSLVVGAADPRFGQRIVAVLAMAEGQRFDEVGLQQFVRGRLAGYKAPRQFVVVDKVRRAANGKADYPWAQEVVAAAS